MLASDAFIVAPGGIGTVLETMMIWQLLQVRHLNQTPLILVGKMWKGLVEWATDGDARSAGCALAKPEDLADSAVPGHGRRGDRRSSRELHAKWKARP